MTQISFDEYMAIQGHLSNAKHDSMKAEAYAKKAKDAVMKTEVLLHKIVSRQAAERDAVRTCDDCDEPANPHGFLCSTHQFAADLEREKSEGYGEE